MTVTSQTTKVTATGNGSARSFSFSPLVIFQSTDIAVTTTVTATGVETVISEGATSTTYSVDITTYPATGSISYPATGGTLLPSTQTITIKRTLTLEQQTDLNNQGAYSATVQEQQFDKLLMIDLQQQELHDRTLTIPISNTAITSTEISGLLPANAFVVINSAGNGFTTTGNAASQWLAGDGTEALPFYSFVSDPDSGMYRIGANNIGVSVSGSKVLDISAAGLAVVGAVEPSGDTASGDNAAIGYTAAEGLILTGQGSTNDVTIKNDADSEVMGVLTGTTTADFKGIVTALTFEPDGDTAAGDNAAIGYDSTNGLILTGQGSSNDVVLKNDADSIALEVPTGTQNVNMLGNLVLTGNLTVNGTTVTNDATNTLIKDPLVEFNSGAASNANDLGFIWERGSTGDNAAFIWDESGDYFQVGTTTAVGSATGNLTVTDAQLHAAGLTLSGTSSDLGTVTTVDINGGSVDGTTVGAASASTGAFTTLTASTSLALATGATVTGILDEDAMGSDSATQLATQQSIKAYVDSNLTAAGIQR